MNPYLTTAPGQLDIHVRGARFASYDTDGGTPGFSALFAAGLRPVTIPDAATGLGVWIAHGSVNGIAFGTGASESNLAGQIQTTGLLARRGSQSVGFRHDCDWVAPNGDRLLTESRTIRVANGPSDGAFLDIEIVLATASTELVTLGRSRYGLLALRIAAPLMPDSGGQLRNSNDDFGPAEINGRQAAWCACNGVVEGETVGLAILDHPDNPWHPSPWVCTEEGLLSPSPFPWRSHELRAEAPLRLQYRIVVHSSYVEAGWVHARLADWNRERI